MKAKNYFAIDTGAYFADEKPKYVVIQDNAEWKIYYSGHYLFSNEFQGDLEEFEANKNGPSQWVAVEIDVEKLKRYLIRNAKPEKWRNFTKAFKNKNGTDCVCDGPNLDATLVVDGKKVMNVSFYGFLEPENLHPHYYSACKMLRYLERNGKVNKLLYWL